MLRAFACAAALLLAACSQSAADAPIAEQWRRLDLNVTQVEFGAESVGQLRFRGGLHLQGAQEGVFGGLSGLEVLEDGRVVAITDDGRWFEARLNLDETGSLIGLAGGQTPYSERHRHIFECAELWQQVMKLVDKAEHSIAQRAQRRCRKRCDGHAAPANDAFVGCVKASEQMKQRALATPRCPDDRDLFTRLNREVHSAQNSEGGATA
jgi:hypothetical protein